jgi:hypothetical protein
MHVGGWRSRLRLILANGGNLRWRARYRALSKGIDGLLDTIQTFGMATLDKTFDIYSAATMAGVSKLLLMCEGSYRRK